MSGEVRGIRDQNKKCKLTNVGKEISCFFPLLFYMIKEKNTLSLYIFLFPSCLCDKQRKKCTYEGEDHASFS